MMKNVALCMAAHIHPMSAAIMCDAV